MNPSTSPKPYQQLLDQIATSYEHGRRQAAIAVNTHLVQSYWAIGQHIVEYEQGGKARAAYGEALIKRLSKDLVLILGKGFSVSNLKRMRQFYLEFAKGATAPHLLTWSHYVELLKIDDKLERSFYEKQVTIEVIKTFFNSKKKLRYL
jgi:predicted nuclease of restriction endonuclease-like (RecB) superfamily